MVPKKVNKSLTSLQTDISKEAVSKTALPNPQPKKRVYAPNRPSSKGLLNSVRFSKLYVLLALIILFGTALFWSILSAKIQLGNADQLVYAYLFQHSATLHGATLPAQHSFIIKWPLFYLVNLFGATRLSFIVFTAATVLVTLGFFVYFIHRIEKRPLVFGTICLALASILLLVPTVPYPGGILPVNMAMITTRNIEYIVYIGSIALLVSSPKLKSFRFWLAVTSLGLLVASDKLFLTFSIGAAILALIFYAFVQYWSLVSLSVKWLITSAFAAVGSLVVIGLIKASGFTSFNNQAGVGPYGLVTSLHNLIEGCVYAVIGILTNLGANPASSATTLRGIPHQFYTNLISVGGVSYIVNGLLLITGIYFAFKVFLSPRPSKMPKKGRAKGTSNATQISILLIWTTIAAVGLYAFSNHDYVVDARYLTIVLFTIFIAGATYTRGKKWKPEHLTLTGAVIILSIITGLIYSTHLYNNDKLALSDINNRDKYINLALKNHQVSVLVGDYWRVMPTKLDSGNSIDIMPLSGCSMPLNDLSSTAWQPSLKNHSFAYILSLDKSLTNYPSCSINQIIKAYGRPNSSTLIAGSLSHPKELLLFYDQGINTRKYPSSQEPATILPISITQLTNTSCDTPTIMNVVAHEDDDLLFMNPDTINSIKAGDCVRSVYITAGNAGAGELYWLNRERGSEAAYSYMSGANKVWTQRIVQIASNEFITVANPKGNKSISLIFMYLPDGNLNGQGFSSSNYESLAKLESGSIKELNTVDGQSSYTKTQLISALTTLMHVYQPTEIRTQSTYTGAGSIYHDHSDHNTVGYFVTQSYTQYIAQQFQGIVAIPIKYYLGYTSRQFPANVTGLELQKKEATFLAYAKYDDGACQTLIACQQTPTYNGYLTRQYQHNN